MFEAARQLADSNRVTNMRAVLGTCRDLIPRPQKVGTAWREDDRADLTRTESSRQERLSGHK
jgi:hypothetical protein